MTELQMLVSATRPAKAIGRCSVMLDNIEVMADIGILAAETGVRQPLVLHVRLDVVPPAADHIDETHDYRAIHRAAHDLAEQRIALIETFARRLAERCLANERVLAAEVRVDKPRAVPGCLAAAHVRLSRA